jgi:hypothetical protein
VKPQAVISLAAESATMVLMVVAVIVASAKKKPPSEGMWLLGTHILLKKVLDKEIAKWRLGANRSQAIEYCIKQVLQLEKSGSKDIEFTIKFI